MGYVIWCMLICRISDEELDNDPAANLLTSASEEAQKVARNEGKVRPTKACSDPLRILWLLWRALLLAMASSQFSNAGSDSFTLYEYDDTDIQIAMRLLLTHNFNQQQAVFPKAATVRML